MKHRWLINLILIGVIATLAALVTLKPGKPTAPPLIALTQLSIDSITKIRLVRPVTEPLVLEKQGNNWQLTEPVTARANRFNINSLLRLAETKTETGFAVETKQLKKYGLETPMAKLWLNQTELHFGNKHPLNNNRYVLFENVIYLLPSRLARVTNYHYTDFLSGRLLEDSIRISTIQLPKITLSKDHEGNWVLVPKDEALSADRINDFIEEWRHASALSVGPYSGKPILAQIKIRSFEKGKKQESLNLGILSYAPEFILYREDEGLEYRFTEETGKRLLKPVAP